MVRSEVLLCRTQVYTFFKLLSKPKRVGIHQNVSSLPEMIYMNGLSVSRAGHKLSEPNAAGDFDQRSWWSLSSCPSIKGDRRGDEASQSWLLVVDGEKVWSQVSSRDLVQVLLSEGRVH